MLPIASLLNPTPCPLLALPTELRLHILSYLSPSFPNLTYLFHITRLKNNDRLLPWQHTQASRYSVRGNIGIPGSHFPRKTTPPILLVCKQLTTKAQNVLYHQLVIPMKLPVAIQPGSEEYLLEHFISLGVLRRVRVVEIKLDYWYGMQSGILDALVRAWGVANVLREIRVLVAVDVREEMCCASKLTINKWARKPPADVPKVLTWKIPEGMPAGELVGRFVEWMDVVEREETQKHVPDDELPLAAEAQGRFRMPVCDLQSNMLHR